MILTLLGNDFTNWTNSSASIISSLKSLKIIYSKVGLVPVFSEKYIIASFNAPRELDSFIGIILFLFSSFAA